jgi:hypothetical protein
MNEGPTAPSRLRGRLAALRARVRRLTLLAGVSRLAVVAVAALAFSFLADWTLELPVEVRRFVRLGLLDRPDALPAALWLPLLAVSLLLAVALARAGRAAAGLFAFAAGGLAGVLVWAAARAVVAPLRVPLPEEDLALSVEERHGALEERLVSALDFERRLSAGRPEAESPAMMRRVVEEARAAAEDLRFSRVADPRAARRSAAVALGAAAVAVAAALLLPGPVGLWARRSLLLEEVGWPRRTTVVAVVLSEDGAAEREKDPSEPYVVSLGRPLAVVARATGRVPSEVFLLDRPLGQEGRPLRQRMRAVPGRPGLFEWEARDVREPFEFVLVGGDDADEIPRYSVSVRVPPRVLAIGADLEYPAYLAMAPARVEGGHLDVPEGTEAVVSFRTDADAASVEAVVDERPVAVEGGPREHRFRLRAERSLRYRIRVVTADGRENDPADATYEVNVRPDAPPRPEWVHPRAPLEATPSSRIPLFARTADDHGVAAIRLEVRAGADPAVPIALGPRGAAEAAAGAEGAETPANDRPYGVRSILSYVPLEISSLRSAAGEPIAPPARLSLRLVAVDTKGQTGESEWTAVDLLRADEVERSLSGRRTVVKGDLAAVRSDVAAAREVAAGLAGEAVGPGERTALREVQFKLGKSRADLERAVRSLGSVFNAYVYGRLGAPEPTEKVLSILDRRHRETFRAPDEGAAAGSELDTGDGEASVFPWSLYGEVVAARRDRVVFDTGVLDKTIAAVEPALEAVVSDAPAAVAAAAEAASATRPDVAAVVAATDRLLGTLDRALEAMREWQSLSDLVLTLRRLIEEQEALHDRIERSGRSVPASPGGRDGGAR